MSPQPSSALVPIARTQSAGSDLGVQCDLGHAPAILQVQLILVTRTQSSGSDLGVQCDLGHAPAILQVQLILVTRT